MAIISNVCRLLAAFALLLASPAFADMLVDNVNGYTLRQDGGLARFKASSSATTAGSASCSRGATAGRSGRATCSTAAAAPCCPA